MPEPVTSAVAQAPNPVVLTLVALLGVVAGHAVRRAVPSLLGLRRGELPFRGPWLEIATGLAWALTVWRLGAGSGTVPWLLFTLLLVAVCATDYVAKLIPDLLTLGGVALGLVSSAVWSGPITEPLIHRWLLSVVGLSPDLAPRLSGLVMACGGAALGFLVLETIRRVFGLLAGLEAMGMGDSKLLATIGAFLGPQDVLLALAIGLGLGVVHGVVLLGITRLPHAPFGPPLAVAAWLVVVASDAFLGALAAFQSFILTLPLPVLASLYVVLLALAVLLILRTRRRAALYEEIIEDDYRRLDEKLEADPGSDRID